jgi:VWFA-related protein
MVPIDVRVVDANGRPITDLRREDFTILENGVPQTISHFAAEGLIAAPSAATPAPLLRAGPTPAPVPQNRRVFLFVLGRGRLTGPSKEAEALAEFIRTRLVPQDHVAVLGYNRATDFTTDHAAVADVVARYRARHERIESMLSEYFSGLRAVYGPKGIPEYIQAEIDQVFKGASELRPRAVVPGQMIDAAEVASDQRRTADDLLRAELLAERAGEMAGLPDPGATATAERLDLTFEQYVSRQSELAHDVGNLYAGIAYMRHLDGEKHLAFISPRGLGLPRMEHNESLARAASDARIAIDIVYTGGAAAAPPPRFSNGRIVMSPVPSAAQVFGQTANIQDLRRVSEISGGQTVAFKYGREALATIDEATRFQYLLGYSPGNPALDGRFRDIEVKVNRRGARLIYRRGYYATPQLIPLDRRQFITETRIAAAGRYNQEVRDIAVTISTAAVTAPGEMTVTMNLRSPRTRFVRENDRHVAAFAIAVFCVDARQRIAGELRQTMDLRLRDEGLQAFQAGGRDHTARIPLSGHPAFVKVVVYDYGADLLGSASRRIE